MPYEDAASPAERYAQARERTVHPRLTAFEAELRFALDRFQRDACAALDDGQSVLVAAPTGAGKTVVAEFAVFLAMSNPATKLFYTAPIKALSNQKYQELCAAWGPEDVGLLTGDAYVNATARIVVMTTEVLRNMLYAESPLLENLGFVVMDEVHYLADRTRGAVWEEVIIHLPTQVRLVSLSATVSNAEELGAWLHTVRGDTAVILSEDRPVPLHQHVLIRDRVVDLFGSTPGRVNPELRQLTRAFGERPAPRRGRRPPPRAERADPKNVVRLLACDRLLPAIMFIFSRAGCDRAVRTLVRSGLHLTEDHERAAIQQVIDARTSSLAEEDLGVLGYWEWVTGLLRGVAAHHAGLLPVFKEVVEELFQRRLLKVVFATETLSLGINMPARSVVLEQLEKFDGEARTPITPGEYTQLTGRAGRRGIDPEGHAVVLWRSTLDPEQVAALASRRSYPLNSRFAPTYNMVVNLVERHGVERSREILELSFAQFQADRGVVDQARTLQRQEESLRGYETAMTCHLGDFASYAQLRRTVGTLERQAARHGTSHADRARVRTDIADARKQMRSHPCHGCADREAHARWAERADRLRMSHERMRDQVDARTGRIAVRFDRVTTVLRHFGYLAPRLDGRLAATVAGRSLRQIYGERDLLTAECLRSGAWDSLTAPDLAALVACLVYEPRREESEPWLPRGALGAAFDRSYDHWAAITAAERREGLPTSLEPSPAAAPSVLRWARGGALGDALDATELQAGDFVRLVKQTVDLLDQVSGVASPALATTARNAQRAIRRGVVADDPGWAG